MTGEVVVADINAEQPDADQLQRLIRGELTAEEEADLLKRLEQRDEYCQLLEELAADAGFRGEVMRLLSQQSSVDANIQQIIANAKCGESAARGPSLDFLDASEVPGSIGQFDGFHALEMVGWGGMGIVLKAEDPTLHRVVALKVLAPPLAADESARARFLREARAAAAVSHVHVVPIHAVSEYKGLPYLVMEFVHGVSLQEKIETEGPLGFTEVLRIGVQTAAGLAAAHAQGLIHRDVKPANILLENSVQRVKLTDFGLARTANDPAITRSGMIAGTPEYMSPEQARGEMLDERSDLFSLGSVLYAMCAGQSPFRADSLTGTIRRVCEDEPQSLAELRPETPPWLTAIIARLHAKSLAERYSSAVEVQEILAQRLAALQKGQEVITPPVAVARDRVRVQRWQRLRLVITALLTGIVIVVLWKKQPPADDPAPPTVAPEVAHFSPRVAADVSHHLDRLANLRPPYSPPYAHARTDRLSVQYAVMNICQQVGLHYQWEKSQLAVSPANRAWVKPDISDIPAREALEQLLHPLGISYQVDRDGLSLVRMQGQVTTQ